VRPLRSPQTTLKALYSPERLAAVAFDAHPFFGLVPKSKSFARSV
jgi:hypothetical protein